MKRMKQAIVYLKAEKSSKITREKVYLGDVCNIICTEPELEQKLKAVLIYDFSKKKNQKSNRAVISILKVIEIIQKIDNNVEIVSLGENDFVLEYVNDKKENKLFVILKVIFVSLICFFGTAFTIMAFHNDINVVGLFEKLYEILGQPYMGGAGPLEIGYSLGLGIGIVVFYNHIGKRRITKDPTPLEVEMRIYEDDVNQTLIDTADREGIEVDVS
ncbi:MAG: stage V sporulation protein AA [Lachnospiraceae bacterium]|nr:stage V sporulation protein AA [Lachnospiraceae bacterium]